MDSETRFWIAVGVNCLQLVYNFCLTARNLELLREIRERISSGKQSLGTKRINDSQEIPRVNDPRKR